MTDEQEYWLARAEEAAKVAHVGPSMIHQWATSCTASQREFFIAIYENRPIAVTVEGRLNERPVYVPREDVPSVYALSRELQYLISTACERVWNRPQ